MRHKKSGRQFGRNTSHRKAMLRALTANLVTHERIETTDAKAKELRRVVERLISQAVRLGTLAFTPFAELSVADRARRNAAVQRVSQFLHRTGVTESEGESQKVDLVEKLFTDIAKRYQGRPGGYTRIIKVGRRRGDNAPMSLIELVEAGTGAKANGKSRQPATADAAAAADAATADAAAADAAAADATTAEAVEPPADPAKSE